MFSRGAAVAGFILIALAPVRAQLPVDFPGPPPAQTVREALDHPYGRALLAEFARVVTRSADPACLKDKSLDAAKIIERGRAMFERYGIKNSEMLVGNVDARAFEITVAARRTGINFKAEYARLQNDPAVQEYIRLERPIKLAKTLDFIFEQFDRYVLLTRIDLKSISPLSTGNDTLFNLNPTEKAEEAVEQYTTSSSSPQLKQFLELAEIATDAFETAFKKDVALKWGPTTFYRGIESDLAEICVIKR